MTGATQLAGIGQPDSRLCEYWVALRNEIRSRSARAIGSPARLREYTEWVLGASLRYGAHAASCPHPQHTNPSYGYDASRRGRTAASQVGDHTRILR